MDTPAVLQFGEPAYAAVADDPYLALSALIKSALEYCGVAR
jgi:hypothetical protein